jgi:hypothetical protein
MLRAIAEGRVCRGLGTSGWAIQGQLPTRYGIAENTVSALVHAKLAELPADWEYDSPLVLTEEGRTTLIRWGCSSDNVDQWIANAASIAKKESR